MPNGIGEVPEAFRPPEWLSAIIPRKAPYYPQMGDEIVYFRQGHQFYIDAVRNKKVYELGPRCEPWSKMTIRVRDEFCCLKTRESLKTVILTIEKTKTKIILTGAGIRQSGRYQV